MGMNVSPPRSIKGILLALFLVLAVVLLFYVSPVAWLVGVVLLGLVLVVLWALGMNVLSRLTGGAV